MKRNILLFMVALAIAVAIIITHKTNETTAQTYDKVAETIEPFKEVKDENAEDEIENNDEEVEHIVLETEPTKSIYEIKSEEVLEKQKELDSITDNKERFLAYKALIAEYSEWVVPPETIYDVYTEDEIYLMQRCIETETFEQSFDSKVNVANVILNRIEDGRFGNSANEIITGPKQFAFGRKNINEDTKLALEYAYMFVDTTDGALYFHSLSYRPKFSGANYIFTDDAGHHFYK